MNKKRIGVIGFGYWGPNLTRNFIENINSEVVMVADLREDRRSTVKNTYPHVMVTEDYRDLFTQNLDAVVVATPPATHYQIAKECLLNGLNVLVEKPLTLNSVHAEELIQIAEQKNRILMVGHTFEYNSAVLALKQLMEAGELGQIYYLDAARLNLGLFQKDSNVLWDLAPHDISILIFLLGKLPISVNSYGAANVMNKIHDVAYVNLVFPDNIMAHIHVSWLDPCKVRRVTVVGSKKMAVYNDIESLEKIKIYDKGVETPEYTNNFGEFNISYRYGDILIPNIRFLEPLKVECQHFLDSIHNQSSPSSCGEDGLHVVKILEAAQRSLDNSGHIEVLKW
ncbi:MAG TPA: Gfo/Idh/MocA family oxidoreductase [Anaerolineaceae bacterium]|nr:Gfo/Idh/MocA family oxidoreductase [Anaerolineaceae bacterium]